MTQHANAPQTPHVAPFIQESNNCRSLHFDMHQLQSQMCISRPDELRVDYTRTMMGFALLNRRPRHIVMIGLGGGSLAKFCYRNLPESRITVVEINPHVIALRKEFLIPDDNYRFKVVQADGADFIASTESNVDVLLVDGYDQRGQPPQLGTDKFYLACRDALTDEGVMAVNLHEAHPFYELFLERITGAFNGNVVEVAANHGENVVVFAAPAIAISPPEFRNRMESFYSGLNQWTPAHA